MGRGVAGGRPDWRVRRRARPPAEAAATRGGEDRRRGGPSGEPNVPVVGADRRSPSGPRPRAPAPPSPPTPAARGGPVKPAP